MDDSLAWKMFGIGGSGRLALPVEDAKSFVAQHPDTFELKIRRE